MCGCLPLFEKHGFFSWLVFQNLCSFVLDMKTLLALNQLSKSLLSPISMVVTNIQPPLFGALDHPKIMSFLFFFFFFFKKWNKITKFPFLKLLCLLDPKEALILSLIYFYFSCVFQINKGLVNYVFRFFFFFFF